MTPFDPDDTRKTAMQHHTRNTPACGAHHPDVSAAGSSATRRAIRAIVLAAVLLAAGVSGCKDEVIPAAGETKDRTLTILAYERDPQTGVYDVPAVGAEITVMEEGAAAPLAQLRTDGSGVASYTGRFPSAGLNVRVSGLYRNQRQYTNPPVFLFCDNQTVVLRFEPEPVVDICCPVPGDTISAVFLDETGRTELIQNTPAGINSYQLTRTLFRNACPSTVINVDIPQVPLPFSIRSIITSVPVQGPRVAVAPGETFSVTFAVSTERTGTFTAPVDFTLRCPDGSTAIVRVNLRATVVILPCDCGRDTTLTVRPGGTPVPVGSTRRYDDLTLLRIPADCGAVDLLSVTMVQDDRAWSIESGTLPRSIPPGGSITAAAVFRPWRAGRSTAEFTYEYSLVNGQRCVKRVRVQAEACRDMCPVLLSPTPVREFDRTRPVALRFANSGERVLFSPNAACGDTAFTLMRTIEFTLPDTACCSEPMRFDVQVIDSEPSRTASDFYTVSPRGTVTVNPGGTAQVRVAFTSPTLNEFVALFATGRRVATGTVADSTFSLRIRLSSRDCRDCQQDIDVTAIVGSFMQLSPIRNLRAYGQRTDLVRVAPAEVSAVVFYTDGRLDPGGVKSLLRLDRSYPYPPDEYDFFVDVRDTSVAIPSPDLPEKIPMLFHVPGSRFSKIQRVSTAYPENEFVRIQPIVDVLQADFLANPAYFTRTSLPYDWSPPLNEANAVTPLPGEVYVIYTTATWVGASGRRIPCDAALLYIRSRDTGRGQVNANTHHQSGIEYRVIYPVVIY